MKLRLRDPHARFSPCKIQMLPIRTIKTPIRLLITRITALNTRRIALLLRGFECITASPKAENGLFPSGGQHTRNHSVMLRSVPKTEDSDTVALPQTDSLCVRRAMGVDVRMAAHSNSSCKECLREAIWRYGGSGIARHAWYVGANEFAYRTYIKMALVFLVDLSRKRCTNNHHCLVVLLRSWLPSMVSSCSLGCPQGIRCL